MRFGYYKTLPRSAQGIYRRSDQVGELTLARRDDWAILVEGLRQSLELGRCRPVQIAASKLCDALTQSFGVPPVRVQVLAKRPQLKNAELHGLYTAEEGKVARIQIWMRTAAQKRVVAFRTLLRTLLHEVCHHLDFTWFKLPDSFHTEGFFRRESSLFRQLAPPASKPSKAKMRADSQNQALAGKARRLSAPRVASEQVQLGLWAGVPSTSRKRTRT